MEITQTKLNKWSKLADEADAIAKHFDEVGYSAKHDVAVVYYYGVESAWVKVRDAIRDALIKTPIPRRSR